MRFFDLLNVLPHLMGVLMREFESTLTQLNATQQRMVLLLGETNFTTMTMASQMMNMEKGSMTPIVDKLISLDYLVRERNPHDRRQFLLELTDKGVWASEKLKAEVEDHMRRKFSVLTEEERAGLWKAFGVIQDVITKVEQGEQQ